MLTELANAIRENWVLTKFRMNLVSYSLLNAHYIQKFEYLEPKEDYLGVHLRFEVVHTEMAIKIIDSEVEAMIKEGMVTSSLKIDKGPWLGAYPAIELHLDLTPLEVKSEAE